MTPAERARTSSGPSFAGSGSGSGSGAFFFGGISPEPEPEPARARASNDEMPSHEMDETDVVVLKQSSVREFLTRVAHDDDVEVVPASTLRLIHFVW